MTPTEREILTLLAIHDGPVRYDHFYWRDSPEHDRKLFGVHLHNLRRKLPAGSIVNLRGHGYLLTDLGRRAMMGREAA